MTAILTRDNGMWRLLSGPTQKIAVTAPAGQTKNVGDPVTLQLAATGGTGTYTWTATGVPPGLALSAAGKFTGTLTTAGTFTTKVTATDTLAATGTASFSWGVGTPPPPPPTGKLLVGASIDQDSAASLNTKIASTLDITRVYSSGFPSTVPAGVTADVGHRGTVYSFKVTPALLATQDAATMATLNSLINSIPAGHKTWICLWHEPENDWTTAADKTNYINGWKVFANTVHGKGRPELKTIWIMMAFSWASSSSRNPLDWYPGDSFVDVIGIDAYNEGSLKSPQKWNSLEQQMGQPNPGETLAQNFAGGACAWATSHNKKIIICEWGTVRAITAPAQSWCTTLGIAVSKAAWISHSLDWMAQEPSILGHTYFNSDGREYTGTGNDKTDNGGGESWEFSHDGTVSYAAFGKACNKYRTGGLT